MTQGAQTVITKAIQKTKQCQKRGKPRGLSQIVIQTSDTWTSDIGLINLFLTLENLGRFVIVAKSNKRTNLATQEQDLIRSKRMELYDLFSQLVKIKTICKGSVIFFFSQTQPLIQVEAGKLIEEQGQLMDQQNKILKLQGILDHQFYHFILEQMNKPIFQLTQLDGYLEKQNHLVLSTFLKHLDNNIENIIIEKEYILNEFEKIKYSEAFNDQVLQNWNKIQEALWK